MKTMVSPGRYGPIEGPVDDQVVFAQYRQTGQWAPEALCLLETRLSGGGTFLDVGANIGLVTIPLLSSTRAVAHCFEPAPNNVTLLTRNLARHGLEERAQVHAVALHARQGIASLSLPATNAGDHHLGDDPTRIQVDVKAECLDDLLTDVALVPPVVMKVDTQGAEVSVLQGAPKTLSRVDHLLIEYWPLGLSRLGHRPTDLWRLLRTFPRAGLVEQDGGEPRMEPTEELRKRLAFFSDDDPGFFDLLLSRRL